MLLVHTKLDKSKSHGIGCFADEFIEKGRKIWQFDPRIDVRYSENDLEKYPSAFSEIVRFYGFTEEENSEIHYVLCGDHARHINHSINPNLSPDFENNCDYASRDIFPGEELTANYYEYYANPEECLVVGRRP